MRRTTRIMVGAALVAASALALNALRPPPDFDDSEAQRRERSGARHELVQVHGELGPSVHAPPGD